MGRNSNQEEFPVLAFHKDGGRNVIPPLLFVDGDSYHTIHSSTFFPAKFLRSSPGFVLGRPYLLGLNQHWALSSPGLPSLFPFFLMANPYISRSELPRCSRLYCPYHVMIPRYALEWDSPKTVHPYRIAQCKPSHIPYSVPRGGKARPMRPLFSGNAAASSSQ